MHSKDWGDLTKYAGLTALALIILVVLYLAGYAVGVASGRYGAQADGYAAQYTDETRRKIESCRRTAAVAAEADECVDRALEASRANKLSEHDLAAQQQMSEWAFWLLIVSVGQTVVGTAGLIGVLVSLRQGREANRIALKIGQAQTRAYLGIEAQDIELGEYGPKIGISVKNSGQSPALYFTWGAETKYSLGGVAGALMGIQWQQPPCKLVPSKGVAISPNSSQYFSSERVTSYSAIRKSLENSQKDLWVYIDIHLFWRDVFGEEFRETHRFMTVIPSQQRRGSHTLTAQVSHSNSFELDAN